ncbi:MAG TPA: right-handed parallel beta-helix repeat-containing protein [bacterium]|nr:right-handed parallel beta-helix repeat-containing protein [bacterium]
MRAGLFSMGALILLLSSGTLCAAQNFHYVPDDFETIAEAIAAADPDDFVIVRDGVYSGPGNVDLDPAGKPLVIQSENGPGSCFIECGKTARAFFLQSNEDGRTIIRGFTIQHGRAEDFGGAIYCLNASPLIDDCHFENNRAPYGAAICAINGSPRINNCHFFNNNAEFYGGSVCLANSSAVFTHCYMAWNFAEAGGGIYCCWFAQPRIVNSLIVWNSAARGGGVGAELLGFPVLENCTLSDNSGSGIFCDWSNCTVVNSILVGNAPKEIDITDSEPDVTYSCVTGGMDGAGNIDADPIFRVGPQGDYYLGGTGTLDPNPCTDAGDRPAEEVCWTVAGDMVCLDEFTTRTDLAVDQGVVDLGYHTADDTDCRRYGARFIGPETEPDIGDTLGLQIEICNPGTINHMNLNLFVIMEEAGEFWFWPSWSSSDWMTVDIAPGVTSWTVYDLEPWSTVPPEWWGRHFYSALTDPSITEIRGEIAIFPYRFDS